MKDVLLTQYDLVKASRAVLLDYCNTMTPADLIAENTGFGSGGSMRNLLVHIGHIYQLWIGQYSLDLPMQFPEYEIINTVEDCCAYFKSVDLLMTGFIDRFASRQEMTVDQSGEPLTTSPLTIFTHVITHEFHHKGQILSMSRQLGYTPVDTDIIRG